MHCHWIPDAVLTEKCDGVAFFEAIALYKSSAEMCGGFFDLKPVQALLGDGIGIARELIWRESGYGRVSGMFEEPLPGREVAWDCAVSSMAWSLIYASYCLTENVILQALERHIHCCV